MHPPRDTEHATILLVEHRAEVVASVRAALADQPGWTVHQVASALDAMDEAIRLRPQVILQSRRLPDGDGLDLVERYVACHELPGTQVVMLCDAENPQDKATAFEAGAFDSIVNLPPKAEFVVRVRHALQQSEMVALQVRLLDEAEAANHRAERQLHALQEAERALEQRTAQLSHANDQLRRSIQQREREFGDRLAMLDRIGRDLNSLQDLDTLLRRLLLDARSAFACEAGSILLAEGGSLVFTYAQNDVLNVETRFAEARRNPMRVAIDRSSIAGAGAVDGMVVVRDAYDLPSDAPFRFNRSFDESTGFRTRAVLAVAMRDAQQRLLGVLQLINPRARDGHHADEFTPEDQHLAAHFAGLAAMAVGRAQLGRSMIYRMMKLAEMRDPKETGAHVRRVSEVAARLFERWAERHGRAPREIDVQLDRLRPAAMLHDVGKVSIRDAVLKKPDRLTDAERSEMEAHTLKGAESIDSLATELDEAIAEVTLYHHARWDGAGYPSHADIRAALARLGRDPSRVPEPRGASIPIFARCVAVADVFDALISVRAYKEAWAPDRVRAEMLQSAGTHFDPELVEILDAHFDELVKLHALLAE